MWRGLLLFFIAQISSSSTVGFRRKRTGSNFFSSNKNLEQLQSCILQGLDFSSLLLNADNSQKCFSFLTSDNVYTFKFVIPICGNAPTSSCSMPTFPEGTMGQFSTILGTSYNLGTYNTWGFSYVSGHPVVNVTYSAGSSFGCPYQRSTVVYIKCDRSVGGNSFSEVENPPCLYTITITTSDAAVCSVLASVAPTSLPSTLPTVYPTPAPTINCQRLGLDLSGLVSTLGIQKCFLAATNDYYYSFPIPACAVAPAVPCSPFSPLSIGQVGTPFGNINYNLGEYTESWNVTSFNNATALSVVYVGGSFCARINDTRSSTVFVLCDRTLLTDYMVPYDVSNCSYTFVVTTPDPTVCQFLAPETTQSPSPAPTYLTAPPGAVYGGYDPADPSCPCNK